MERNSLFYKVRRKGQVLAQKILPPELMSKVYSCIVLKKRVDLKNPKTFNEKIQWCKIHAFPNILLVIKCADKYAVREYVKEKGMEERLVPLHGIWQNAEEIDWEALPQRFVLKCTHGCAYNILCSNKAALDKRKAKKQLSQWLKEDFGEYNLEYHYSRIKPRRIICEEFLGECITDYKFFCFHGDPKFLYVSSDLTHDRQAQIGFFYPDGTKMPMKRDDYTDIPSISLPPFYEKMKQDAKTLSADFPFVRVDFFLANGTYYFAELTFTPGGGMMPFNPERFDLEWGNLLDISGFCEETD